jgi:tripartite motif-containing protein 2/3
MGNVLNKFGCSKHLEFPNGVVVNDRQEIFISDNRAHCVKVFNYDGLFLRQIGGEGQFEGLLGKAFTCPGAVFFKLVFVPIYIWLPWLLSRFPFIKK